jgi:hypothetical protein
MLELEDELVASSVELAIPLVYYNRPKESEPVRFYVNVDAKASYGMIALAEFMQRYVADGSTRALCDEAAREMLERLLLCGSFDRVTVGTSESVKAQQPDRYKALCAKCDAVPKWGVAEEFLVAFEDDAGNVALYTHGPDAKHYNVAFHFLHAVYASRQRDDLHSVSLTRVESALQDREWYRWETLNSVDAETDLTSRLPNMVKSLRQLPERYARLLSANEQAYEAELDRMEQPDGPEQRDGVEEQEPFEDSDSSSSSGSGGCGDAMSEGE